MSYEHPDGIWRAYRYEVFIRGRWKLGGYYGGETREDADARAIDRLQHLWNGQVRKIRRVENEMIIWERKALVA